MTKIEQIWVHEMKTYISENNIISSKNSQLISNLNLQNRLLAAQTKLLEKELKDFMKSDSKSSKVSKKIHAT